MGRYFAALGSAGAVARLTRSPDTRATDGATDVVAKVIGLVPSSFFSSLQRDRNQRRAA